MNLIVMSASGLDQMVQLSANFAKKMYIQLMMKAGESILFKIDVWAIREMLFDSLN